MSWLKEILLELCRKLNSWQSYSVVILIIIGVFALEFYKAGTERIRATPDKFQRGSWVSNDPTKVSRGIEKNDSQTKLEGAK